MKNVRSDKRMKNTSKFISLILRHRPEAIGISLDEHGWADVQELIDGINRSGGHSLDMVKLEEIVRTDEKQRYSFNEDHTLIRANQGHPFLWMWNWRRRLRRTSSGMVPGRNMFLRLMRRVCSPKDGCMSIFPRIWKRRKRSEAGMENR